MTCRLLALDPSMTAFGWCLALDKPAPLEAWQHGTWRAAGLEELALTYGRALAELRPDLVVFEQPLQVIMLYGKKQLIATKGGSMTMVTPNASQTILWKIEGAIRGIAALCECPTLAVPPKTWRATILGDGSLPGEVAKTRAKQICMQLGIPIKSVDEAEACCVGLYGLGTIEFRNAIRRDIHGRNREVDDRQTIQ